MIQKKVVKGNKLRVIIRMPEDLIKYTIKKLFGGKIRTDHFGILESIVYSWRIDVFQRYSIIAKEIYKMDDACTSILDVGGSGGVILSFIDASKYNIYILDLNKKAFSNANRELNAIIADGCKVPFKDDSFDVVTSVDSLEHIPDSIKPDYLNELKRVAKKKVFMHFPATSSDGLYQGEKYDIKFNEMHKRLAGIDESNTVEHIKSGLPKIEDIKSFFPNSDIIGTQNCEVWYKYMIIERLPYISLLAGLIYLTFWKKKDNKPPYHACLIRWEKR